MKRLLGALVLVIMLAAGAVRAQETMRANTADKVEFAKIKTECLETSVIRIGTNSRWQDCRLVRTGFVATIGLEDFYYAEYCLLAAAKSCDRSALLVFRNRAYRAEAYVDLVRIDPPGTRYDIPVFFGSFNQHLLATEWRAPGRSVVERDFYHWKNARWEVLDSQSWRAELKQRVPAGLVLGRAAKSATPDPRTMALQLPIYRSGAKAGKLDVALKYDDGRFAIADLNLAQVKK